MKTDMLSVKPVKKYAAPKYPMKADATRTPALLRKLPSRWEKNSAVVAALGLLGAMTLTSCANNGADTATPKTASPTEIVNYLNVAPVFFHGHGTGSIGCDTVVPPVFLSEEEALAIIKNEAETVGLNFSAEPPNYVATNNMAEKNYSWENQVVLGDGNVSLELYDGEKNVAVTYISMHEAGERYLPDEDGGMMWSSVESFRPRDLAELTAGDFARQEGDISVGVFYEPGMNWDLASEYSRKQNEIWEEYQIYYDNDTYEFIDEKYAEAYQKKMAEAYNEFAESNTTEYMEELLRAQVRDFIEWLQGQGII